MNDERHGSIDRILTLLSLYWHAKPHLRIGQVVAQCTPRAACGGPGDSYHVTDTIIEEALTNAVAHLDHKPIARHPAGCVAHSNPACAWLRDGTKVVLCRESETKGRAWLEVDKQATVHLAEQKPAQKTTDELLENRDLGEALKELGPRLGDPEQAAQVRKELEKLGILPPKTVVPTADSDHLRAEIVAVQQLLRDLADDRVFERTGLEARLQELEAELASQNPVTADWPILSPAEKCEAVLKRVLELVNETEGRRVTFEADCWGGNTLTVYVDDAHSHTGVPDGTWEQLADNLYRMFCTGGALGFCGPGRQVSDARVDEVAKTSRVCKTCGADPDEDLQVERDAVAEWLEAHQGELRKYQGKRIAVHPEQGIVASGETLGDVYAEVKKLGLLGEVCFSAVPRSSEPEKESQ